VLIRGVLPHRGILKPTFATYLRRRRTVLTILTDIPQIPDVLKPESAAPVSGSSASASRSSSSELLLAQPSIGRRMRERMVGMGHGPTFCEHKGTTAEGWRAAPALASASARNGSSCTSSDADDRVFRLSFGHTLRQMQPLDFTRAFTLCRNS
jgi:hypothetical protein